MKLASELYNPEFHMGVTQKIFSHGVIQENMEVQEEAVQKNSLGKAQG